MSSTSGAGSLGSDVYTMEHIVASRTIYGNKVQYLIKWQGYPDSENTWEPEENIIDTTVIMNFRKQQEATRKEESTRTSFGSCLGGIDSREKKKVLTKNLTELASSVRKGHDPKIERKLDQKQEELRKKKARENESNWRKQLSRAGVDTDDDDDHHGQWHRDKVEKSSKPMKAPPPPVFNPSFAKQEKVHQVTSVSATVTVKSEPVDKPKCVVKPRTIKDAESSSFFVPPPPPPPAVPLTGYEKGYKAKDIIGISSRGAEEGRCELMMLVQWEDVKGGDKREELVPLSILRFKEPQMLIAFFEPRITFHNARADPGETSESSSSSSSSSSSDEEEERREHKRPQPPQRPVSPAAV